MTKITSLDQLASEWGEGAFFRSWVEASFAKNVPSLPTAIGGPDSDSEEVDFGTWIGFNGGGPDHFDVKSLIAFFIEWDLSEDSKSNSKLTKKVIEWLGTMDDDKLLDILKRNHPEGDLVEAEKQPS